MKKGALLVLVVVLGIAAWKLWAKKQAGQQPPAVQLSADQLQSLVDRNGTVDLTKLSALLPPATALNALKPQDREHIGSQLTRHLRGTAVRGECCVQEVRSKGAHFLCVGSYGKDTRTAVTWYVPKSQANLVTRGTICRVDAAIHEVELLPTGVLQVRLERPTGR